MGKDILCSSGITIDVDVVHRYKIKNVPVSESPFSCSHPALTIAIQAGLEHVVPTVFRMHEEKISTWMAKEDEVMEVVQLLLDRNADVNKAGDESQDCESAGMVVVTGKPPLCAAIQRGPPKLVKMLLDAKADPNYEGHYSQSAWGPDRRNPFGPGVLRPESWLDEPCNGSVSGRSAKDPRVANKQEIMDLLTEARSTWQTCQVP